MKKLYPAFVALVCSILSLTFNLANANAAPLTSPGVTGFAPSSGVEEPGTYPPKVTLYGGYTTDGTNWQFARLVSTDGFATPGTLSMISGPSYVSGSSYTGLAVCPAGKSCGGYAAYYTTNTGSGHLYRCTGFSGTALSGCSEITGLGFATIIDRSISLTADGNQLLLSGGMPSDTKGQIYSLDTTTLVPTKLTACGDSLYNTNLMGGVAGSYIYVIYNSQIYRFSWTGTTCMGSRQLITAALGWDDAVGTSTYNVVFGNLTGTAYDGTTDVSGTFKVSKKDASCGDSYVSMTEKCDNTATSSPFNGQTCTSSGTGGPSGFTGGTLACNGSCGWDTSMCTAPSVCGNGVKEGSEVCDGSDFGGATCASVKGPGWTGSLVCTGSCTTIDSSSCTPPAPICGDGVKNGSEACDGSDFGGATCASVKGPGWTGSLVCTGSCTTIDSSSCIAPPPVCGDGSINGAEECDSSDVPPIKPGDTCASKLGVGYTGSLSCTGCLLVTSACVAPPSCGNGVKDPSEQCEGSDLGGKSCADVKGTGWTGTLACTGSCTYDTTSCTFNWGIKSLSGACSLSGSPNNPTVSFTGGACSADYWPIGALSPAKIKWASVAGKAIAIAVATSGSPTVVSVPPGVDHTEVLDNGNHYELGLGSGTELGVEGTIYSAIWQSATVVRITCTDGKIILKKTGLPFPGITISGEAAGVVPAGWTVDIDVFSGTVVKAPSKLDPGDAGPDAGDGGSDAGDAGTDSGADGGSDSGLPPDADAGTDSGTPPDQVAPSDPGGCHCATAGNSGSGIIAMLALLALAAVVIRRRN